MTSSRISILISLCWASSIHAFFVVAPPSDVSSPSQSQQQLALQQLFSGSVKQRRSLSSLRSQQQPQTDADRAQQDTNSIENRNNDGNNQGKEGDEMKNVKPDILQPFLPAMDPMYKCQGPVGEGEFIISRTGEPTTEELANENILKIVQIECSDLEVNTLVWKCLGYRFDADTESWSNEKVFPNWRERYPEPPDFIGMRRVYSKEVDEPCLRCNQALVRSIPTEQKQCLKPALKPLGFRGYQYAELTPNKTRRAQCANWLIFYRDNLFGYTVDELRERRLQQKLQKEQEEKQRISSSDDDGKEEWKPPVREVY